MLLRARNAGPVQPGPVWHREPEIVGKGEWEPIISEEGWRAVHKLLTDPLRLNRTGSSKPKWLGSGIYLCGRCGSTMRASEGDHDEGLIDGRRYKPRTDKINELSEVEERLAEGVQRDRLPPPSRRWTPNRRFLDAPLDVQCAVLRATLRVETLPATAPRRAWKKDGCGSRRRCKDQTALLCTHW